MVVGRPLEGKVKESGMVVGGRAGEGGGRVAHCGELFEQRRGVDSSSGVGGIAQDENSGGGSEGPLQRMRLEEEALLPACLDHNRPRTAQTGDLRTSRSAVGEG